MGISIPGGVCVCVCVCVCVFLQIESSGDAIREEHVRRFLLTVFIFIYILSVCTLDSGFVLDTWDKPVNKGDKHSASLEIMF